MDNLKTEIITDEMGKIDLSFKIIIIGDSGVGKSSLTLKATKDKFQDFYTATVGFEFFSFNIKINDTIIKLQIWDTCGQEIYRSLISSFYKNSALAMVVYSIDNKASFQHIDYWIKELKNESNPDTKIILIGNKSDLEDKRSVTEEEAQQFAMDNEITEVFESSAKTGFNAKNIFIKAAKILYKEHIKYQSLSKGPNKLTYGDNLNKSKLLPTPKKKEENIKGCC